MSLWLGKVNLKCIINFRIMCCFRIRSSGGSLAGPKADSVMTGPAPCNQQSVIFGLPHITLENHFVNLIFLEVIKVFTRFGSPPAKRIITCPEAANYPLMWWKEAFTNYLLWVQTAYGVFMKISGAAIDYGTGQSVPLQYYFTLRKWVLFIVV